MTITGAFVLFAVTWFMCLFISLQVRITTQSEGGENEPGTPASAPHSSFNMKQRLTWVTVATVALWIPITAFIMSGTLTIQDLDWFGLYGDGHY